MDQFGFLCLSFLLSVSGSAISYRVETERGLSPGCVWLPLPPFPNATNPPPSPKLQINCQLRKLPVDFWNYTLSREQLETTTEAFLKCNEKLFFESLLHPNQHLFHFKNLEVVQIQSCKIRKIPKRVWSSLDFLKSLVLETHNGDWSSSYGLEVESGGFEGLARLETLNLSWNNIWSLPDTLFCPLRSLRKLNLSQNRLSIEGFGNDLASSTTPLTSSPIPCPMVLETLDLSFNTIRKLGSNGFVRMRQLIELRLQNNQIEDVEEGAFGGLNQLKLLNLSSNRLVTLPFRLFTGNPHLRELHLQNNSITALSPSLFSTLDELLLLDLSRNGLSSLSIKDAVFGGLVRLMVLKLSFNALSFIDPLVFSNLMSLQALQLDNNRIENLHPEAFVSLSNLHVLDLTRNRLSFIDARLFGNMFVLRQLYLDHNKIRRIEEGVLLNVTSLRDLGLAGNLLSEVPVALRLAHGIRSVETLDLGENRITVVKNDSFQGLGQVYGLRLVDNRLVELPPGFCSSLNKLHVLNVAQNKLSKISSTAFSGCPNLRALRLDTNNLEELPGSLSSLPSLLWLNVSENRVRWADYHTLPPTVEWLDLSHNSLVTLGGLAISSKRVGDKLPIRFHLRVLDASHNNLTHLDYTTVPPTLETLRLNSNRLKTLAPDTFSRAGRLRRVELMGNQLESLPLSALRIPAVEMDKPLPELFLGGNSFNCTCDMEWLTRVNQLSLLRQYPQILDLDGIMCKSVSSRKPEVTPLPDMKPRNFLCPYRSHCFALCQCCDFDACDCAQTCPGNCTCFHDSAWSANIVECSNLDYKEVPRRIPMDATELFMDGNKITVLGSHIFIGKKNLRSLFINGSQVEEIRNKTFNGLKALETLHLGDNFLIDILGHEFVDLDNLLELHLQNNRIRRISSEAFENLKFLQVLRLDGNRLVQFKTWELSGNGYLRSLRLSANPWSCDCEFLIPFRTWIHSRLSVVSDFGLAMCQNTMLVDPEQLELEMTRIPIESACRTSEDNASHNYALNEGETNNHILGSGGEVVEKEAIHHSHPETEDGAVTGPKSVSDNASGTLLMLSLTLAGLIVFIVVGLLIFRMELHVWCLRHLFLIDNLNCHESRRRSHEKVCGRSGSSTNIFFSDEGDKLFDAYFLYNRKDEELLTQKLTPELEHGQNTVSGIGSLRLLLHYRDLCQNSDPSSSWNPDMILSAAETSKRVVIILSKTFLQAELAETQSRLTLQSLIQRSTGKLLFILLPPLNEMGIGSLYPELRNKNTILDWLDPNFFKKLRILLPTPRGNQLNYNLGGAGPAQTHQNEHSFYNQSLNSSNYHRNILPYQLQVPPSTSYEMGSSFSRNNSLPPTVPKHHIILPVPNWQTLGTNEVHRPIHPTQEPTYFSFADNFRFHQQQHQTPLSISTLQNPERHYPESGVRALKHPYLPLHRHPPPLRPHLISPESQTHSMTTDDSGNVNNFSTTSSSDELENEHVYSTLDSPLQSPSENFEVNRNPSAGSPEKRTMYFV